MSQDQVKYFAEHICFHTKQLLHFLHKNIFFVVFAVTVYLFLDINVNKCYDYHIFMLTFKKKIFCKRSMLYI